MKFYISDDEVLMTFYKEVLFLESDALVMQQWSG